MSNSFDIVVVGAGPAGYTAALRAARLGMTVCVVERDKPGGVCLNVGCIPTKCLASSAALLRSTGDLEELGVSCDTTGFDYRAAIDRASRSAERLSGTVCSMLERAGVIMLSGSACLTPSRTVMLDDGRELHAESIILATGSSPRPLPGIPFDGTSVLTSTDMLSLKSRPGRLLVAGGGAVGCEFSSIYAAFGSTVTLVEMEPRILPGFDTEIVRHLQRSFKRSGVGVKTGSRIESIEKTEDGVSTRIIDNDGHTAVVDADVLLAAVGRDASIASLCLDGAGIRTSGGNIVTGDWYETDAPGVYAVGDVIGAPGLAHAASREAEIAVDHIAGRPAPKRIDAGLVPWAVFAEPELAGFGLTGERAEREGIETVRIAVPYRSCGKAVADGAEEGVVKVLVSPAGKRLLGAHIAGYGAAEIIHQFLLAATADIRFDIAAATVHIHPTLSEIVSDIFKRIDLLPSKA